MANQSVFFLRFLVENFYDIQNQRIAVGNQLSTYEREGIVETAILREHVHKRLQAIEAKILRLIKDELSTYEIWEEWLEGVSGIGPVLAGGLISWIGNPEQFATISKLWAYSGFAVGYYKCRCENGHKLIVTTPPVKCPILKEVKGKKKCGTKIEVIEKVEDKAPRRERGYLLMHNGRLKSHLWKVGESFVKMGKGYRDLYEQYRRFYDTKYAPIYVDRNGDEFTEEEIDTWSEKERKERGIKILNDDQARTKLHRYNMAKRKTVKIFLAHLWTKWRELENLPVRAPYVEKLGDHEIIPIVMK